MHCPNCGKETPTDLKYCRSCGMSLEAVSKALADHLSVADTNAPKVENEKAILRQMLRTMGFGGIIFFAGIVLVVIGRRFLHNDLIDLIGGLILLAGVFIMCYALFSSVWSGMNASSAARSKPVSNTSPEGLPEPMASVTEETTNLLEPEPARNPKPDRSREADI